MICDPASLEVVLRVKRARTDRIDASRMVKALRAYYRGEPEAMAPRRVPSVAEEDAKRLIRTRQRLLKGKRANWYIIESSLP